VLTVLSTAPSAEIADRIATTLIEERLAACVNVLDGLTSVYRWEGQVEREAEVLMLLKTTTEALERLQLRLVELHPYAVPEVLALEVSNGHLPYLEWVRSEVGGDG
jgi:periplasmic divalent cation tolerance protein